MTPGKTNGSIGVCRHMDYGNRITVISNTRIYWNTANLVCCVVLCFFFSRIFNFMSTINIEHFHHASKSAFIALWCSHGTIPAPPQKCSFKSFFYRIECWRKWKTYKTYSNWNWSCRWLLLCLCILAGGHGILYTNVWYQYGTMHWHCTCAVYFNFLVIFTLVWPFSFQHI